MNRMYINPNHYRTLSNQKNNEKIRMTISKNKKNYIIKNLNKNKLSINKKVIIKFQ